MKNTRDNAGFTFIEIIISILIVMTLAAGAMGYQYHCTRDVRLSEIQTTAARLSMLLLEGWKGSQAASDFEPVDAFDSQITIDTAEAGPAAPDDWTPLGCYEIDCGGDFFYVTLSWKVASEAMPKILNVAVAWRPDHSQGTLLTDQARLQYSAFYVDE